MKKTLYKVLGEEGYLKLISKSFIWMYKRGMKKESFPQHHYINELIKEGDYVIDLGANLGYYTVPFSIAVGKQGKVYSVEPVPLFEKILRKNVKMSPNQGNITIYNYALGKEEKDIEMGLFVENGVFRHGLTKVLTKEDKPSKTVNVKMTHPEKLFNNLERLDYIKCDIEGFEIEVLPLFEGIIKKFKPTLQIEFGSKESRTLVQDMLLASGYKLFKLDQGELKEGAKDEKIVDDIYFIHSSKN